MADYSYLVDANQKTLQEAQEDLDKELIKEPPDFDAINYAWAYFRRVYKTYSDSVNRQMDLMCKDSTRADDIFDLRKETAKYEKSYTVFDIKVTAILPPKYFNSAPASSTGSASATSTDQNLKKMLLPKRALPQFTGEVREWLSFWAAFEDIHLDKNLSTIDKFHYLIQSTKEDTSARKLLQSYPFCAANYPAAVDSLKERFGRPKVLVKVYVRDLLQLVIEASTGRHLDFGDLVTTISSQIRNLETLGVTQDRCEQVLYPVVEACLPQDVLQAWQRSRDYREEIVPLMTFLRQEVNQLTDRNLAQFTLHSSGGDTKSKKQQKWKKETEEQPTSASLLQSVGGRNSGGKSDSGGGSQKSISCWFCEKSHYSEDCRAALGMPLQQKKDIIKEKNVCGKCMRRHKGQCSKNLRCPACQQSHKLVLCPILGQSSNQNKKSFSPASSNKNPAASDATLPASSEDNTTTTTMTVYNDSPDTPLQSLYVLIHGPDGKMKRVRGAMDGGSQKSYGLTSNSKLLGLKPRGFETFCQQVFVGKTTSLQQREKVKVFVSDLSGGKMCNFDIFLTDAIAHNIASVPNGPWMNEFQQLGVAFNDMDGNPSDPIEIVFGNDIIARLYTGRIHTLDGGPAAIETVWGWVPSGKFPVHPKRQTSSMLVSTSLLHVDGNPLSALWSLETIGIQCPTETNHKEELERQTQRHFDSTVSRLEDGRYEVCLPWITGAKDKLSSNRFAAEKRLKMTKDLQVKGYLAKYDALFKQWESDGRIEEVTAQEYEPSSSPTTSHYLFHRAVVKLSSSTTPIRPVFDGSAKQKGKLSLNDCLDKGPNLLELIPPILTRFRLRKVGILADVKQAFQHIGVAPADRNYLKFLWWTDDSCKKLKVYRHCRVVFGVTCSPYLLAATLRHHLKKNPGSFAATVDLLLLSTYVDNTVLSLDDMEEAKKFEKESVSLLLPAQFDLRGWEFGPEAGLEENKITSVLGLKWDKVSDELSLDVSNVAPRITEEPTLRKVLSLVHAIYDPLGFACPFTLGGKLLLRRCHEGKYGLDGKLDTELKEDVLKWAAQIPTLADLQVPRHVHFGDVADLSLHAFGDASSLSTAAAVFLRVEKEDVKVYLLAAKSRVAPKKMLTIPRLELVACLLAARLLQTVKKDIGDPEIPVNLWSDSSTALAWIRGVGPWGVFVNNCVDKVRAISQLRTWRHIPGKLNIADLPSRGCSARKLVESRWWEGPQWLLLPPPQWPTTEEVPDAEQVDRERKKTVTTALATTAEEDSSIRFLRRSSHIKTVRALAVLIRLQTKIKEKRGQVHPLPQNNSDSALEAGLQQQPERVEFKMSGEDMTRAETALIKYIQKVFQQQPDRAKKLKPQYDEAGLLRTKTRLTLEDDEEFTCPLLLPDHDEFVERLIRWEHIRNCHAGTSTLLALLRERFWIINGRRTVRSVITKCWTCRRYLAQRVDVPEAPLPKERSNLGAPFSVTGVDAAGPLFLRGGEKTWVLLFTCATYRAVHLELVDTLSADGFLRAFRKFVARRGRPSVVYSDNARGFVAAAKALSSSSLEKMMEYATVSRIDWRFNPPASPWWGGWWERLIGLMKQLLRRILGRKVVHREELEMMLVEVEDCLNNRPLTYQSENVDDPLPLTPNHFVRSCGSLHLPEVDLRDSRATRAAYRKLQSLREALRSRFRTEYLGFLRGEMTKKGNVELKRGDIVLVEKENSKRVDWPLGVIEEKLTSRDGRGRLYRVRTRSGVTLRPAQRLYVMEQEG